MYHVKFFLNLTRVTTGKRIFSNGFTWLYGKEVTY